MRFQAVRRCCILLILGLVGVFWIFTLGIVVNDYCWYGGQANVPAGEEMTFNLWIDTHVRNNGMPLFFCYYSDRKPYSIRLLLAASEAMASRELVLDDVSIVYPDGVTVQIVSPEDNWSKRFVKHTSINSLGHTPESKMEHCFAQCIARSSNFRLQMSGWYPAKDGSTLRVRVDQQYRLQSVWKITTGWAYGASL